MAHSSIWSSAEDLLRRGKPKGQSEPEPLETDDHKGAVV